METYSVARMRILNELERGGWNVKKSLKVPWAEPPDGRFKLWFKAQAIYLNSHSLRNGFPIAGLVAKLGTQSVTPALSFVNVHRSAGICNVNHENL